MKYAIKAALAGLVCGLLAFVLGGSAVYALLLWHADLGQLRRNGYTPQTAIVTVNSLDRGVMAGIAMGLIAFALVARRRYRRLRRRGA